MSLISLIVILAIVGFLLWLIVTYIPMVEPFKKIIIGVVIVVVILWLLQVFGIIGLASYQVPRIR